MATPKTRMAFAKVLEKGMSVSAAMREVGYSHETAKVPTKLTRSKGWKELMNKHFPDSKLAALHKKLLEKKETIVLSDGAQNGSHIEWTGQPHTDALKALETAYKLKGRYSEEALGDTRPNQTVIIIHPPSEIKVHEQG